jgi:AAA+ superfamily predicted ATPase
MDDFDSAAVPLVLETSPITFDSIIGQKDAIKKLKDLSTVMNNPDFFKDWPIKRPKAYAFTGPSGCGKTETLRAFAHQVDCPYITLTYEQIAGPLYGETTKKLESFKNQVKGLLKEHSNLIVLIDEADGIFGNRNGLTVHHVDKQIITFFLRWLDGLDDSDEGLIFIATSNAWETVDPALRRGGRFSEVKFKPLTPLELVEAFRVKAESTGARVSRDLFSPDLNYANGMLDSLTGADVNYLIETLVFEKALACFEDRDLPKLIGVEDLTRSITKLNQNKDKSARSMGFGR